MKSRLILASASPRRKQLLEEAGYDVVCVASGVEEIDDPSLAPEALALENASRKIEAVKPTYSNDFVIAADTVVALEGRFFGKPANLQEAAWMLNELSGRTHMVVTGVAIHSPENPLFSFAESSMVTFHNLSQTLISEYLRSINPLDKAGAYAAQEEDGRVIQNIVGSHTNVIGLPMERLQDILRKEFAFGPNFSSRCALTKRLRKRI